MMSISGMMNTTCTIKTETQTVGDYNQVIKTLAVRLSNVSCRAVQLSPDTAAVYGGKFDVFNSRRFYFDSDHSINTLTDWISFGGEDYQVHSVNNAGGGLNRLWQVDALRKRPD